ncbi:tRNA (adenosine(37)-N6)-dimethylallyltransferase MiaA [Stackebrandtia nassauensis]|uniref:tRNA dimethylallyltransferase n=1 Tax=Stackebrandtia nassauensis (strain DSM 44728 / CIP 108903 / NRRL B-16338 / NBRC 102104 / LLR-40K-21) TaxID=446470 RepID=D3Q279_STANL|nr:tRNA (adenosine(37)-N6)-dimethylallyltransferase MiaA [Stackebrandtia nassauensis]ADD43812.1 tRNA delta(2)-isopentenylpyrophosphate transferase [Stackebrandtia nassauensis DSM 44728]
MDVTGNRESLPGPVVIVCGPTATGKSALSLAVARERDGEIVNADSMQLYRGMDIGTAKLTVAEREGVPHHLLDIWDVRRTASVAEYQALARATVDDILARGRVPVLVGGSGLYIQAVVDAMEFPGTDPVVRARLETELAEVGPRALHDRLASADPDAAAAILPSNGRRIVRALEVVELTGSFTATLPRERRPVYRSVHVGVDRDTAELDERIALRVDLMLAAGLVEEVRTLAARGLAEGLTAGRALGYRQLLQHLDGERTLAEAREATITGTRRFVRRQRSWFGRDDRIAWLDGADPDLEAKALKHFDEILELSIH